MNTGSATFPFIRIAALALLAGMLCSWPLWDVEARAFDFPVLPLMENFGQVSGQAARWMAVLGVLLLGFLAFFPFRKTLLGAAISYVLLLCALDLNRLQPWVWLYLLVFSLAFFGGREQQLRYLLAAVYFWSGFHKLTPYFAEDNFQWFCSAFSFTEPLGHSPTLGYAVAVFEMSLASGLLWSRSRPFFKWIAIGLHIIILLVISPLGHNWNLVIVPWNLVMMAFVWVSCANPRNKTEPQPTTQSPWKSGQMILIALAWLSPALNILGLWPHTLSWQLYTNTQPEGTFYVNGPPQFRSKQSEEVWKHFTTPSDSTRLYLDDWAMQTLRVPLFPSNRTFRQTAKYLCGCLDHPDSAGIYILTVNRWDKSAEQMEQIPCTELLKK